MSLYEKRLNEYREKTYWPEYHKHAADAIKKLYPQIPADADPNEVVSRYKGAFAPDMSDEDFYAKLDETHTKGWKPSVEEPKPNLIESAQMVATPENALEMGKGIAHFGAGQAAAGLTEKFAGQAMAKALPAWMQKTFGKAPAGRSLGRIGGQLAMAAPTAAKLMFEQQAGASLEKTAQEMPQPNIQALEAKGYSPAQIHNVLRGYADVQKSLYEDMQKTGEEGVETAAEGIANTAFFGFGGDKIKSVATRLMGGKALAGGVGAAAKSVAGGIATHAVTGAAFGGGYGVVHGATDRMAKAAAAGLGANDILTAGWTGAMEEGITGPKEAPGLSGAVLGGIIGGVIGAPAEMFTTTKAAAEGASVRRKAIAAAHIEDAQRVNLKRFAEEFKPAELPQRFPEDLAAAGGDDVALANNIVGGVWGTDVAATEHGQQAASRLYEKIAAWRTLRDRMNGPMIDLPAAVEAPQASITPTLTPEQQAMGLQPNALPAGVPPQVAPMQGLEPVGAGAPVPGGMAPQPNVVGEFKPTPEMQPMAPPQGVQPAAGLQPLGAEVPRPETPLTLEGVQPAAPQVAGPPRMGPPLGPVETGGRPLPPAPEINPKLEAPVEGTPAPALPVGEATEPRPVRLPTHADRAIESLGPHEHVTLATDEAGKHLTIEKLGVTAGTLAKPGASSDALAHVNAIADEHGLPVEAHVTAQAGPRGGKIPLEKLLPWYEQHGYEVTSQGADWATVRRAPSMPALAERVEGLPAAEAKLAGGNVQLGEPMVHASFGERLGKVLDTQAEAARARIKARGTRLNMGLDPADLADHSIVLAAEMFSHGMRSKAAVAAWLTEKYGATIKPHIDAIYEKAQKRLTTMFKTDARATTKLKELVALRDSGAHGADWYEETSAWVNKTFAPEDSDMFLRFLALTSADSSTEAGAALAMKAFGQWKQGLPFDGMRGPHMVKMLNDAVRGENFGGDKIQSFYRALRGEEDAVVLDRWMIRALGLPSTTSSLSDNNYKLYSQIVRNLASDADMSPRQLQAAIWEGARVGDLHKRWKKGGATATSKVGSARPLEHLLQREFGGMTPYQWVEQNKIRLEDLANMSAGMKAAREQGGYSFDPQTWKTDETPGYVVTLASDVVPRAEFYPAALTKFKNSFKNLISTAAFGGKDDARVNIGVFDMGEHKPGHFSMDLNMVLPDKPGAREKAIEIGKMNRQFQVGRIGPDGFEGIDTGYNPKKHGPQHLPPKKGPERAAWFREAAKRASTMLDATSFTLKPKER